MLPDTFIYKLFWLWHMGISEQLSLEHCSPGQLWGMSEDGGQARDWLLEHVPCSSSALLAPPKQHKPLLRTWVEKASLCKSMGCWWAGQSATLVPEPVGYILTADTGPQGWAHFSHFQAWSGGRVDWEILAIKPLLDFEHNDQMWFSCFIFMCQFVVSEAVKRPCQDLETSFDEHSHEEADDLQQTCFQEWLCVFPVLSGFVF